tara:strand:- start:68 stop:775 length:708 start_codon:yes stop_codon:yes gene_type:complete
MVELISKIRKRVDELLSIEYDDEKELKKEEERSKCSWCGKELTSFWSTQPILAGIHRGKKFHVKLFVKDPNNCYSRWLESGKSGTKASNERKLENKGKLAKKRKKRKLTSKCRMCGKTFYPLKYKKSLPRSFCSNYCYEISEEIKKIKESERQSQIRQEAEKKLYGKVKTKKKRVPLSKALRDRVYRKYKHQCMICSQKQGLHIHHKDHDPKNNAMRNLLLLCGVCHKKIHMKVR